MRPIIEFCANNMHFGTDEVMDQLEENPDYDVIEYGQPHQLRPMFYDSICTGEWRSCHYGQSGRSI